MLFNSVTFIFVFLPVCLVTYYLASFLKENIQNTAKNIVLLIFSIIFMLWSNVENYYGIAIIILTNFHIALFSDKSKKYLIFGAWLNVYFFFHFKILNILLAEINEILIFKFEIQDLLVPLGLSFVIFHCISYQMDIYNGKAVANRSIIEFSLYILYFPKLIQGPIVKYYDFYPFLKTKSNNFDNMVIAVERFIIGLAKKVLIGDVLAMTIDSILAQKGWSTSPETAILSMILFTIQIYVDFSAYSDMAIAISNMFGFKIAENFNFPYASLSITEFWRRWHISLGAWFREYLYIPLGGSRRGNTYVNIFIVFLVTGLWHGTSYNYILWGVCHGMFMLVEKFFNDKGLYEKIPKVIRWFYTITVVSLGWIAFKQTNLYDCKVFVYKIIGRYFDENTEVFSFLYYFNYQIIFILIVTISIMLLHKILIQYYKQNIYTETCRYIGLFILFTISISAVISSTYSPFIYFQF